MIVNIVYEEEHNQTEITVKCNLQYLAEYLPVKSQAGMTMITHRIMILHYRELARAINKKINDKDRCA